MSPPLHGQTKQVVFNVYNYFKARKLDRTSAEHRDDINLHKIVAKATGVSQKSVERIVKTGKSMGKEVKFPTPIKKKQTRKKKIEIDSQIEEAVRRKVTELHTISKVFPTINKLRLVLKKEGILDCGYEYMRQLLEKLGFQLKIRKRN